MSFKPFLAYSASAGSGKTFALAARYVALLFLGESPSTILAATFTNKAAAEMRQRVVDALRTFGDNEAFAKAVSEQTGLPVAQLRKQKDTVLRRFLHQPNHIVTLDAFFASILRASAFEIGLMPDFALQEAHDETIAARFLDEAYKERVFDEVVDLAFWIEDKRRLEKTAALYEVLYRLDPLLPPYEAEAVREASHRIDESIDRLRRKMLAKLQAAGASKSAVNNFVIDDTETFIAKPFFAKSSLAEHNHFKKAAATDASLEADFSELKRLIAKRYRLQESRIIKAIFATYQAYKNALLSVVKKENRLSFDDVTYLAYRLLHETVSKEFVYFKLDARFKHILLDEFQDTSTLQFLLLMPLIDEIFAGSGQSDFRSFFYVGDTKQSLYRFRGGVEALFDAVAQRYGALEMEHMTVNYRSSRAVVDAVNGWFKPVMPGFVPQRCRDDASQGYVEVRLCQDEVLSEALAALKRLHDKGIAYDAIACLVQTNKEGQRFQEMCREAGIAAVLQTSSTLRYRAPVAALVSALRYLLAGNALDIEPLCAQSGKALEGVDLAWFRPDMTPLEALDRLIVTFERFDGDRNILRLLEFAAEFDDIADFLEEFERISLSVASDTLHGVRIMTVHGSKGLEFDYVVVLDRSGKEQGDRAPLLFDYDERLHVRRIYYRMKNREYFDAEYRGLKERLQQEAHKDRLNMLYVALSRASMGMVVLRKERGSIFEPLRMEAGVRGQLVVSQDQRDKTVSRGVRLTYRGVRFGEQTIHASSDDEAYDSQAVRFGEATHYALEMLSDFCEDALDAALTAMRNRYGAYLSSEQVTKIQKRLQHLLSDEGFKELIRGATCYQERAFVVSGQLRRIDLLIQKDEECIVVDYKTSLKQGHQHDAQVQAYVQAVGALTGKPTQGYVVYLLEEGVRLRKVASVDLAMF